MSVLDIIGNVLVVVGALVFVIAAVGLVSLFDPYTRASSVATAAGVGVALVVIGIVMIDLSAANVVKGAIAIVLQLATSAIGGMAIARAAVISGHRFENGTDTEALDALDDRGE